MSEPMSLVRFATLADAYGGVIARWPEAVRAEAIRLAAAPAAVAILNRAGRLDLALDAWRVPSPDGALADRIAAAAPAAHLGIAKRARLWWSGIGLAAALAGAATGTAAVALFAPPHSAVESGTSFGDLGPEA